MNFLLAASSGFGAVREYMHRSGSFRENWFLYVAFAGIAVFWLSLYLWDKYRKRFLTNVARPKSLFAELCQAHHLNRGERALLSKAAASRNLEQAAIVFLDPDIVGEFARGSAPEAHAYSLLLQKLFGPDLAAKTLAVGDKHGLLIEQ